MICKKFLSVIYLIISLIGICYCYHYESEEFLRENILKLVQGKLDFTNFNIPFFKDDLIDTTPKNHSEYDFIVIGAGSAGATIASRLSAVRGVSVLLVEAGFKEYPIMDIPLFAPALQLSDQINWKYETESSDKFCRGMIGSKCLLPRGKVMGGSSVLNFMLATRGNKNDYDNWANETGDESWSYKEMLKYFKKLEDYKVKDIKFDNNLHGKKGPVKITTSSFHTELATAFIEAGQEINYPGYVDYNGNKEIGFSYFQSNIKNGERWSTNRAYLHPAKNRKNLVLTSNSHVNKILIDNDTKQAYGVQFTKSGVINEVMARKEIILSAGAINSPQILMLSGIGPESHLRELGIEVVKDAPVGENFMDHVAYGGLVFTVNDSATFNDLNILDPRNPSLTYYANQRTGPFVLNAGFEGVAYINVDTLDPLDENPNIELLFGASEGLKDPLFSTILGILPEFQKKMIEDKFNSSSFSICPMLMNPKSRGRVLLKSKNPQDKPLVYANYLDHPDDVKAVIKGIRFTLKLTETNVFKKYGSKLYQVPLQCEQFPYDSDEYWECALRTYTMSIYHLSGTCRMGREDDKSSVVNSDLQVIGIKGLRVADASIMPKIVSAHPNIPIIAIGEKIADSIKNYWRMN